MMKYVVCSVFVLLMACSNKHEFQFRDGHPMGAPADSLYTQYWDGLKIKKQVQKPRIQRIDREILMTQVMGRWVVDPQYTNGVVLDESYIELRADGVLYAKQGQERGQWDMRKGRVDVWVSGEYEYSIIKVNNRICRLFPDSPYGFIPLSTPK